MKRNAVDRLTEKKEGDPMVLKDTNTDRKKELSGEKRRQCTMREIEMLKYTLMPTFEMKT